MRERNTYPNPGIGNVGSYYVAGHPYVTGSNIDARSEVKIQFPFVAKSIKVKSVSEKEIRVHYTSKDEGDTYLSQRFKRLPSSGSVITLDSKCKEIYVSNPFSASAGGFHLFAELTHIDSGSMYSLTGTVNLSGAYGMPVPQGVTSWYVSTNIDGSNNNTLTDGDRVSTWVDLSGNGYDLIENGGARPFYHEEDSSGDSPTFPVTWFGETETRHRMFTTGVDFQDILPTDGKSVYVVFSFDEYMFNYAGGSNRGVGPYLFSSNSFPAVWGVHYGRYDGNRDCHLIFVQEDKDVDYMFIGNNSLNSLTGKFIVSFRQDGYVSGSDNYFISCYNPVTTASMQGEVENTPYQNNKALYFRWGFAQSTIEFYEMITFNRVLSDSEDAAIVSYLNTKWGVGVTL